MNAIIVLTYIVYLTIRFIYNALTGPFLIPWTPNLDLFLLVEVLHRGNVYVCTLVQNIPYIHNRILWIFHMFYKYVLNNWLNAYFMNTKCHELWSIENCQNVVFNHFWMSYMISKRHDRYIFHNMKKNPVIMVLKGPTSKKISGEFS